VFTARYAHSPYITQIRFVFNMLTQEHAVDLHSVLEESLNICENFRDKT
jgi:hypothetical protein